MWCSYLTRSSPGKCPSVRTAHRFAESSRVDLSLKWVLSYGIVSPANPAQEHFSQLTCPADSNGAAPAPQCAPPASATHRPSRWPAPRPPRPPAPRVDEFWRRWVSCSLCVKCSFSWSTWYSYSYSNPLCHPEWIYIEVLYVNEREFREKHTAP